MRTFFFISAILLHLLIATTATFETKSWSKTWKSSTSGNNGITTTTVTTSTNGGPPVTTTTKNGGPPVTSTRTDVGSPAVTASANVGLQVDTTSVNGGPQKDVGPPTVTAGGPPHDVGSPTVTAGGPPTDIGPPAVIVRGHPEDTTGQNKGPEMVTSKGKENKNQVLKPSQKGSRAYQFMAPQNEARAGVGEKPLIWDEKLASYARWWANQRKADCNMEHSHGPYGENVYWGSGNEFTPADAAKAWVEEKKSYHHEDNSCEPGQECLHYTQIVWKTSSKVGCAKVTCDAGKGVFMVCEYDPPGNYVGELPY